MSHKQVVHLQIGRNLLEKTSPEQQPDRLFAIVDHLDRSLTVLQPERTEIARLNLMADRKQSQQRLMKQLFSTSRQGLNLNPELAK